MGSISPRIANLTDLTTLTLQNDKMSGTIPKEIGNLNLTSLYEIRMIIFHPKILVFSENYLKFHFKDFNIAKCKWFKI